MRLAVCLLLALFASVANAQTFDVQKSYADAKSDSVRVAAENETLRQVITQKAMDLINRGVVKYQDLRPLEKRFNQAGEYGQIADMYTQQARLLLVSAASEDDVLDAIKLLLRSKRCLSIQNKRLLVVQRELEALEPKPEPEPEPEPVE